MTVLPFDPWPALVGGLLIGLSGVLFMALNGRIAGISGILGGLLPPQSGDVDWRIMFVAGLIIGGLIWQVSGGNVASITIDAGVAYLIPAGLLVGFGTQLGSGCTSGHGVCGIGRLSPRGTVATLVYIAVAAAMVFVTRHIIGG